MTRNLTLPLALCCGLGVSCAQGYRWAPPERGGSQVEYQLVRHPRSKVQLPRLSRFRNTAVQEKVNRELDSLAGSLLCEDRPVVDIPVYFKAATQVTYAADDVLSVSVHASYYCGGPYPTNDANLSVTYDLKTGSAVSFEELFTDYQRDAAEIVRALYPERIARAEKLVAAGHTEPGENCDDDPFIFSIDHLLESGFSYALSNDGLIVQPNFPHVIEACAEVLTVPFERILDFAASNGILARVANSEGMRRTSRSSGRNRPLRARPAAHRQSRWPS